MEGNGIELEKSRRGGELESRVTGGKQFLSSFGRLSR